ncbi:MAG: cystathionine beta-synthase [Chloroflexi bacterium]|nr:cystathionine beta-synthase [Chloroflexota bacterium]
MEVYDSILNTVGNTPLVRLRKVTRGVQQTVLAKVESANPGGSVKDRIGLAMVEDAERRGLLRPGGTIVEPTSGNTGTGLAIVAALKGYRMICVMPDKVSMEKRALLKAYGAEVVVTPTAVPRESSESYYSVADRLAREIPGAFQPNQYFNPANPQAHYESTGPELWRQTDGTIDVLVTGLGTGGTVTGTARYLKEQNPDVLVVGADPEGSLYSGDTPRPYLTEGIGEDFIPGTIDLSLVDRIIRVSDRDAFLMARRVTREEGILIGGSAGCAMHAALEACWELPPNKLVVVIFPDTGRNYLSKVFNDEWMRQHGFLERFPAQRVGDVLRLRSKEIPEVLWVDPKERVGRAIDRMQKFGVSQLPVAEQDGRGPLAVARIVGSIDERNLLDAIYREPEKVEAPVSAVMGPPFPLIDASADVEQAFGPILGGSAALVVAKADRAVGLITRLDLLEFAAQQRRRGAKETVSR